MVVELAKGRIPWNKGKRGCYSEEYRQKISDGKKGSIPWNKGKVGCYSEETRKRMGEVNIGNMWNKGLIRTEETRQRISLSKKGKPYPNYKRTPEGNRRIIESPNSAVFKKGDAPWNKGLPISDEVRKRISATEKAIGHQPSDEARRKAIEVNRSRPRSLEHRHKLSIALKGHKMSLESRAKMSKSHKGVPLSQSHKIALTRATFKTCRERRPTKPEYVLGEIIEKVCPQEYKYTGNGVVVIGYNNPDFTNVNGQKKVIEMFGDYWHRNQNPQDKIDKYAQFGFSCLVIWEKEVKNTPEIVMAKVKQFNEHIRSGE
jgi:very-short-patch-repair endonuclease